MRREPLFVRFANSEANASDIIQSFLSNSEEEKSNKIAEKAANSIPDLNIFKRDFQEALEDLIDSGVNQRFINYVNSYMKPALTEYVEGSGGSRSGEKRWISIKEEDTPWIEAIVCYNLSLYIRMYGLKEIKRCPVCRKFFSNKGKYAKYCSDPCKGRGSK